VTVENAGRAGRKTFGPYPARVDEVHDGDTVYLTVDLGFGHQIASRNLTGELQFACRVYGINAPELSTVAGVAAAEYAKTLLPVGTIVSVRSYGWDKYGGRFDGSIDMSDGGDFSRAMVDAGHAKPYFGKGKKP